MFSHWTYSVNISNKQFISHHSLYVKFHYLINWNDRNKCKLEQHLTRYGFHSYVPNICTKSKYRIGFLHWIRINSTKWMESNQFLSELYRVSFLIFNHFHYEIPNRSCFVGRVFNDRSIRTGKFLTFFYHIFYSSQKSNRFKLPFSFS